MKQIPLTQGHFAIVDDDLGKYHYLGTFSDETEAAKAYDTAAIRYFGHFAKLNLAIA